jgi:hypothetical protein
MLTSAQEEVTVFIIFYHHKELLFAANLNRIPDSPRLLIEVAEISNTILFL